MTNKMSIVSDVGSDTLLTRLETHWQSYENKSFDVEIAGESFIVHPAVYNPDAPITRTMAHAVEVPAGARVLDLGCGVGLLGLLALRRGAASCVFADLNPAAVQNTIANVAQFGVGDRATVVLSDLFSAVGETPFDVILLNAPFLYAATDVNKLTLGEESGLFRPGVPPATSFFDPGYKLIARFFATVREHLAPGGFIQFAFSNLGNRQALDEILTQQRFRMEHVRTENTGSFEWQVYRVRPDVT